MKKKFKMGFKKQLLFIFDYYKKIDDPVILKKDKKIIDKIINSYKKNSLKRKIIIEVISVLKENEFLQQENESLRINTKSLRKALEEKEKNESINYIIEKYKLSRNDENNIINKKESKINNFFKENYQIIGTDKNNKNIYLKQYPNENKFEHQFAIILNKQLSKKEVIEECKKVTKGISGFEQEPNEIKIKKSKIKNGILIDSKKGKKYWYAK